MSYFIGKSFGKIVLRKSEPGDEADAGVLVSLEFGVFRVKLTCDFFLPQMEQIKTDRCLIK